MFSVGGTPPPGAPANKAASATGPSVAPSKASGPKASHHPILPSAAIAAYYSPDTHSDGRFPSDGRPPLYGYNGNNNNIKKSTCGSKNSTTGSSSYAEDMERDVGRYQSSGAAGIGMKGVVLGMV